MSLANIQKKFIAALQSDKSDFLDQIHAQSIDSALAMQIYQNSFQALHIEALSAIFPICQAIVGEAYFRKLALFYLKKSPPEAVNLLLFGKNFFEIFKEFEGCDALPYLVDVALIEWAFHAAFHGPDPHVVDWQVFPEQARRQAGQIHLYCQPTTFILASDYPVKAIVDFHRFDEEKSDSLDVNRPGGYFLVWRRDYSVSFSDISFEEYIFLESCLAGKTLAELLESQPGLDFQTVLNHLIQKSVLYF